MRHKKKPVKKIDLIAHRSPKSPITEQYRLIRTNIHLSSRNDEIKSIVVTSAAPSEGKSTTVANLAIVLAQQGEQVLLVDADLRKPSLHYAFAVHNLYGLTTVLNKERNLYEAISKTDIPNLNILTSGPVPQNPSELLNSKFMETIIEEIKDIYEYVVFDTPPVLEVTDSQILANKVDGIVMVVNSGKTSPQKAIKAKELLEKTQGKLLGVVVNETKITKKMY
ncbi:CpsD/CapB family tyrosine-protein kinase [Bacillus sp. JJ722]|uniref:CpsD/CapB family tyrosine-protein kinase n=1 Tax=Bacillus sp. JJ722 TaxID=3122973 RepID=UPI003F68AE4C